MNTKRRTLSQIETFKIMQLISEQYAERKETDTQFAVYACAALNLEGVNHKHIERARNSLNIPSTQVSRSKKYNSAQQTLALEALQDAEKRLCNLELKVEALEKLLAKWQTLFPSLKV
jgi:hypothetical protein